MTSNKSRYPTKYINKCSQKEPNTDNDINDEGKDEDNEDNDEYDDTKLNIFIVDNRNEIMDLCNNKQDEKLMDLINDSINNETLPLFISDTLSNYCITTIAEYCIKTNNLELFRTIIQHYCLNCSNDNFVYSCIITYLSAHYDPISFLNILIENDVKIYPDSISYAMMANNTKFVSYLASINYGIVEGWDVYLSLLNSVRVNVDLLSVSMLKVLMDHYIDISINVKDLIIVAIGKEYLDVIEFLVESFPDHDINQYLNICCQASNVEVLVYFLKSGADINVIGEDYLSHTSIDVIKVLITHNYVVPVKPLKDILIFHFAFDDDLQNVNYLFSIGAQIQWIFDIEHKGANRKTSYLHCRKKSIYSNLEFVITKGHIKKIKLLADNHLNELKPKLNRLFIIACANGRNDIATYLFDLGAELDDKAMICACFFGHYETVVMLLKFGMNLSLIKENLFTFTSIGYLMAACSSDIYNDLINNNIIFRNDIYNYGNEYLDIVKLLINYNVPIGYSCIFDKHSDLFYDVEIFRYFLQNGMNINKTIGHNNLNFLEIAIIVKKEAVIEFLLQNGIDKKITNKKPINEIINNNEYLKNLLLMYGVDV